MHAPIEEPMYDGGNTARAIDEPAAVGDAVAPSATAVRDRLTAHLRTWMPLYAAWLFGRLIVLVVGFGTEAWMRLSDTDPASWRPFLQAETYPHYADVALHGYTLDNASSFPVLPALLAAGRAIGIPFGVTGMVAAHVAFLVGLVAVVQIGQRYVGRDASMRAGMYLALTPFAYWFSITSTESLLLGCIGGSVLLALRGTSSAWLVAGVLASSAALSRPPGAFVGIVLAGIAIAQLRRGRMGPTVITAAVAAGALIPLTVAGFFAYLRARTGDAFAALHAQADFNRELTLDGPVRAFSSAMQNAQAGSIGQAIELVVTIGAAVLLVLFASRAAGERWEVRGWVAFGAASLLLPVASGVLWQMPRFVLLMPPVLWMLGALGARRRLHVLLLVLFPAGLAVRTVMSVAGVEG